MPVRKTAGRFSVMTLNLRFGRAADGENSWENRRQRYRELFQEYQPDLIGMQEANGFQVDYLSGILEDYRCIGQRIPAPAYWQDNVIFYHQRWSCKESGRFFYSHTPEIPSRFRDSRWPRQCIYGVFQCGSSAVLHCNTHFDFLETIQEQSARLLRERIGVLRKPDMPVFVTGDFNALPASACYRVLTQNRELQEVYTANHPGTYHGFTGKNSGWHIDWILFGGPVACLGRSLVDRSYGGGFPSDHFPVVADFQIKS